MGRRRYSSITGVTVLLEGLTCRPTTGAGASPIPQCVLAGTSGRQAHRGTRRRALLASHKMKYFIFRPLPSCSAKLMALLRLPVRSQRYRCRILPRRCFVNLNAIRVDPVLVIRLPE